MPKSSKKPIKQEKKKEESPSKIKDVLPGVSMTEEEAKAGTLQ